MGVSAKSSIIYTWDNFEICMHMLIVRAKFMCSQPLGRTFRMHRTNIVLNQCYTQKRLGVIGSIGHKMSVL